MQNMGRVGWMVGAKLCRLNKWVDGCCFCRGLHVERWVRPMRLIGRGETGGKR